MKAHIALALDPDIDIINEYDCSKKEGNMLSVAHPKAIPWKSEQLTTNDDQWEDVQSAASRSARMSGFLYLANLLQV